MKLGRRLSLWLLPWMAVLLTRLLWWSYRKTVVGEGAFRAQIAGDRPYVLALWHENVILAPVINRNLGITVMISPSFDGTLVTRLVELLGNHAIRGSSSRGGLSVLRAAVKVLRQNRGIAITPDGPKGPALQAKEGVAAAAMMAGKGVPVIPFCYVADSAWEFSKSWDRARLPKPFSKVVVRYGEPLELDPETEPACATRVIQQAMDDNRYQTHALGCVADSHIFFGVGSK